MTAAPTCMEHQYKAFCCLITYSLISATADNVLDVKQMQAEQCSETVTVALGQKSSQA